MGLFVQPVYKPVICIELLHRATIGKDEFRIGGQAVDRADLPHGLFFAIDKPQPPAGRGDIAIHALFGIAIDILLTGKLVMEIKREGGVGMVGGDHISKFDRIARQAGAGVTGEGFGRAQHTFRVVADMAAVFAVMADGQGLQLDKKLVDEGDFVSRLRAKGGRKADHANQGTDQEAQDIIQAGAAWAAGGGDSHCRGSSGP
jgi:hypothetical protein